MAQTDFGTLISELQSLGVYDYFLPFLLIFAIVFAILEKTKIFGEKTNINVVVSILIALIVISLIGGNPTKLSGSVFSVGVIVIILALIWALSPSIGWSLPFDISERTKNL